MQTKPVNSKIRYTAGKVIETTCVKPRPVGWQTAVAIGSSEEQDRSNFGINAASHRYAAGISIYGQGEEVEDVYCIQSGLVKLLYVDHTGKEIIVGLRRSGFFLGLATAILRQSHSTTAETITPCILQSIPVRYLKKQLNVNPAFSSYIHELHAAEIKADQERLIDIATRSTRHNLLKLLSQVIVALMQAGSQNQPSVRIPMKQWEVARLLAVTPEHLNRILKALEDQGLVIRKREGVIIPQAERLVSMFHSSESERVERWKAVGA
jgi:CRP-like cAMP-binding protein